MSLLRCSVCMNAATVSRKIDGFRVMYCAKDVHKDASHLENTWAVVDLDSETVVGSNLVLIPRTAILELEVCSDTQIVAYAKDHGIPVQYFGSEKI